jgi:hypothetical protein
MALFRTCDVCGHELRPAIDAALVAGEHTRTVAGRFGVDIFAVKRHRKKHLRCEFVEAAKAIRDAKDTSLLAYLEAMQRRAWAYEAEAHAAGDLRAALQALRDGRATAELVARLCPQAIEPAVPERRFVVTWGKDELQSRERAERAYGAGVAALGQRLEQPGTTGGEAPPAGSVAEGSPDPSPSRPDASPDRGGPPSGLARVREPADS